MWLLFEKKEKKNLYLEKKPHVYAEIITTYYSIYRNM